MRRVLITGATGAVGSVLVPLFAREAGTEARLVLRPRNGKPPRDRLDDLFAFWANDPDGPPPAERVEALAGDVGLPRLGLSSDEYGKLVREVTHIVHSA